MEWSRSLAHARKGPNSVPGSMNHTQKSVNPVIASLPERGGAAWPGQIPSKPPRAIFFDDIN